jgi:hypothetical protein
MGRPAKSESLHRLQGTRKHASTVDLDDDSKQFAGGRLKMPEAYKQDPKRLALWRKLFGALHRRRTLTKADSAAAELLVENWVLWETVNAEAQARPFSESVWTDKNGDVHSKTVESAASKMAATLQRGIMQALKEFSATPASREKTKRTKESIPTQKMPTERERLDVEIAELRAADVETVDAADDVADDELLASIPDEVAVTSPSDALLDEADAALREGV